MPTSAILKVEVGSNEISITILSDSVALVHEYIELNRSSKVVTMYSKLKLTYFALLLIVKC